MKKIILVMMGSLSLFGCDASPKAVLGSRGTDGGGGIFSEEIRVATASTDSTRLSCETEISNLERDTSVEVEVKNCAQPRDALLRFTAMIDGKVLLRLKKLSDGKFPTVASIVFDRDVSDSSDENTYSLRFQCNENTAIAREKYTEITCEPVTRFRVSNETVSETDIHLTMQSLVLTNESCGSQTGYKRQKKTVDCESEEAKNSDSKINGVSIPALWTELH